MIKYNAGGAATTTGTAYTYEIKERLCKAFCPNSTVQPVITKQWQISDTQLVGSIMYFTIQPIVTVVYQPKNSSSTVTKSFIEEPFTVSYSGANSASTLTIVDTDGMTEPLGCCSASSHGIRNVGNLALTFVATPS